MSFQERLHYFLEVNQLTASEFADKLGVQRSGMSHLISGRNKPSFDFVSKFKHAFPDVDLNWLITGSKKKISEQATLEYEENVKIDPIEPKKQKAEVIEKQALPSPVRVLFFYDDGTFQEFQTKGLR